jgi:hypothetical protein
VQQAHVDVARQAVERAADARQLQQQRHEVFERRPWDKPVERREEAQLRRRVLRVRRDEVVGDFGERGQVVVERRVIAREGHVDSDARARRERRQAFVERVIGGAADEGSSQLFTHDVFLRVLIT